MNRLALGTVQFGLPYGVANKIGKVSLPESKAMLEFAKNNGVDMIDTAISYGDSEQSLGVLGTDSLIITLDDLKKIIIDIKVPENFITILKPGLKAEIFSTAFDKNFNGKIDSVSSRVDPSTRSILARVIVDNSKFEIIPGQLLTVKIIYDEIQQIGVPESSVTIQGKTAFVYVVNGEIVERKNIQIGKRNFGKVSVVDGISEGDQVITEGVSKVRDKAKVKIIEKKTR